MKQIIYKGEKILNIPNAISLYRLAAFPLILFLALTNREKWFVIFLCISLISDILDGNIARCFKLQTRFGAALDNLADLFTYAMALLGIYLFKWSEIRPHAWILYIFLGIFALSYLIAFYRFGKIPGLHLFGGVTAGYIQGIFFFVLFVWGFYPWLYYLSVGWGILAYLEKILVLTYTNDIRPGIKGLYWLLKEKHSR